MNSFLKLNSPLRRIGIKFQRLHSHTLKRTHRHETMAKNQITLSKNAQKTEDQQTTQRKHFCLFVRDMHCCLAIINTLRSAPKNRSIVFNDQHSTMLKNYFRICGLVFSGSVVDFSIRYQMSDQLYKSYLLFFFLYSNFEKKESADGCEIDRK